MLTGGTVWDDVTRVTIAYPMHVKVETCGSTRALADRVVRLGDVARGRTHRLEPIAAVLVLQHIREVARQQVFAGPVVVHQVAAAVAGRVYEGEVLYAKFGKVALLALQDECTLLWDLLGSHGVF
jgi:hypothetical protein